MTFEDDLLELERRVLTDAAGDYLLAVAELRSMLAMGSPGIQRKLITLAIPAVEQIVKQGIVDGFAAGADWALGSLVHTGDNAVDKSTVVKATHAADSAPSGLLRPVDGLDDLVRDSKSTAILLLGNGADIDAALAPVFHAATSVRSTVVTQINAASNTASRMVGEAVGSPMVWEAERDACVYCLALAGEVVQTPGDLFPPADAYDSHGATARITVQQPPLHPHCLPGDAVVTPGSRVTGASSRIFKGEMVRIRTLSGKELSATPNHPVLTNRGWVALGQLRVGDRVLSRTGTERPLVRYGDGEYVPASIGQVAESVLSSSEMATAEVPVSAEDFHGDGTEGEIAHVAAHLHLPAEDLVLLDEHVRELDLDVAGRILPGGIRRGDPLTVSSRLNGAPNRVMGSSGESSALLWGSVRHALEHGSRATAWLDAALEQARTDSPTADPEAVGDALLALAGEVVADELIDVERYAFHGPVFNIETETGWYIGNGIIVHNCRCRLAILNSPEYADTLKREAQRSILRGFSLQSESNAVRVRAAERLLARDPVAPKSVKAYAAKAVREGKFPRGRKTPDGDPRLVIK